ncbi:MAG: TonB family protein [Lacunisphaera sp.]
MLAFLLMGMAGCASWRSGFQPPGLRASATALHLPAPPGAEDVYLLGLIDEQGRLKDWLVAGSTTPEAETLAVTGLRQLQFEAGSLEGASWPGVLGIHFVFRGGRLELEPQNPDLFRVSATRAPTDAVMRVYQRELLDRTPALLRDVPPQAAGRGRVVVQFWVDQTGTVRLPTVIATEDLKLARAALAAVAQWRFSVPMRKGRPSLAVFRQEIEFR